MADLTLNDGREIVIDLSQITIAEYRALFEPDKKPEDSDPVLAKCCGISVAEVQALPFTDYKKLSKAFLKAAATPDPN